MKLSIILVLNIAFYMNAIAQSSVDLKPIEIRQKFFNTKYFYDDQDFDSPYGLQIPIMKLDDSRVSNNYNAFKKSKNAVKVISLISSGLSLYAFFNLDQIPTTSYLVVMGSIAAITAFFNVRATLKLNKAIERYNKVLSGTELGMQFNKTKEGVGIVGVQLMHKF